LARPDFSILESGAGSAMLPGGPSSAALMPADGLVHITYNWKRRKMKYVVITPTKLSAKPIIEGKWPE
jgi:hypothetical protein